MCVLKKGWELIQAGLARSGKMFACEWEDVDPDMYILGKALGGGVFPISCVVANKEVLGVFNPGSHGSTFGGNPMACAVSIASIDVLVEENFWLFFRNKMASFF